MDMFLHPVVREWFVWFLRKRAAVAALVPSTVILDFLFWACAGVVILILLWLAKGFVRACLSVRTPDSPLEATYDDPNLPVQQQPLGNSRPCATEEFPSLFEEATITLSLIVPAYNESVRLPPMLRETLQYLKQRRKHNPNFSYEIIVVDDGSRDDTAALALDFSKSQTTDCVRLLRLAQNHGKGGAVRKGMLRARGKYLLMVDADAATRISDVERLEMKLEVNHLGEGIAIGSRHLLQADAVATRSCFRNILMYGFNFYVSMLCVPGVKDTQCGFKLFTRNAARKLFPVQHIERWAFDVELLHLAARLSIPVTEVAVEWTEMPGSKVNLVESIPQMARDILIIRLCYTIGIWSAVGAIRTNGGVGTASGAVGTNGGRGQFVGTSTDTVSQGGLRQRRPPTY